MRFKKALIEIKGFFKDMYDYAQIGTFEFDKAVTRAFQKVLNGLIRMMNALIRNVNKLTKHTGISFKEWKLKTGAGEPAQGEIDKLKKGLAERKAERRMELFGIEVAYLDVIVDRKKKIKSLEEERSKLMEKIVGKMKPKVDSVFVQLWKKLHGTNGIGAMLGKFNKGGLGAPGESGPLEAPPAQFTRPVDQAFIAGGYGGSLLGRLAPSVAIEQQQLRKLDGIEKSSERIATNTEEIKNKPVEARLG